MAAAIIDLIVPPRCAMCGGELDQDRSLAALCHGCRGDLTATTPEPRCRRCAAVLTTGDRLQPKERCYNCRDDLPRFDAALALGSYDGRLRDALLKMKSTGAEHLSQALGSLVSECRAEALAGLKADLVVPVPLHWRRRWSHGTNSAELLAAAIGQGLGAPIAARLIARSRATRPHANLTKTQRASNVRGAFFVRDRLAVAGKRVLLVDDILTTGATCNELARALKEAGADWVGVVAAAKTQSEP